MKCHCGAATDILETRQNETYVKRRRLCHNGHRFTTQERAVGFTPISKPRGRGEDGRFKKEKA